MTMPHTYAVLELGKACIDEITAKLREAGCVLAFGDDVIYMHGIAVTLQPADRHGWCPIYVGADVQECRVCRIQRLGSLWRSKATQLEWREEEFPTCKGPVQL